MVKGHRTQSGGGLVRTHSRTSSAGSKVGLNLQFTQKDPPTPARVAEKPKRNLNGRVMHDTNSRSTTPLPRPNSRNRIQSREEIQQLQPLTARRQLPAHATRPYVKHKADFTLASPASDDEEEWVSSESGAATPLHDSEEDDDDEGVTPVRESENGIKAAPSSGTLKPRDEDPPASRRLPERKSSPTRCTSDPTPRPSTPLQLPPEAPLHAPPTIHPPSPGPPMREIKSEATSPTQPSRDSNKRHSMTRPPSVHSITANGGAPMRPHPLIRGHSYGQGSMSIKPSPLAPLTDKSGAGQSQISSSPPQMFPSISPSAARGSQSSPDELSVPHMRRTSVSSARSVATLPVVSSINPPQSIRRDRNRTLSTISSSSSSSVAALSSLAHLPSNSITRPSTPQSVAYFPVVHPHNSFEAVHSLLPAPYFSTHFTVLGYRSPIRESYDRVIRAKQTR